MAFRDSDILKSKVGDESKPVFTEEDRAKIRKTLTQFSKKVTVEKKQENATKLLPNIVDQVYHVNFAWKDFPAELDEVPHLFLIRLHLWPLLIFQTQISLEGLQEVCIQSGITGIATDRKGIGYYLTGNIPNGGPIKSVSLTLRPCEARDVVILTNCTFVSHSE